MKKSKRECEQQAFLKKILRFSGETRAGSALMGTRKLHEVTESQTSTSARSHQLPNTNRSTEYWVGSRREPRSFSPMLGRLRKKVRSSHPLRNGPDNTVTGFNVDLK